MPAFSKPIGGRSPCGGAVTIDWVSPTRSPSCVGLRLEQLLADALPTSGAVALSGSMLLGRSSKLPPFVLHVKPVGDSQSEYGARPVAALVLIVEPGRHHRIDPGLVARTLRLTPAESQVAVSLAEGKNVRDIARATGLTEGAIYWHLKQIYQRLRISPAGGPGAVGAVDRRIPVATPLLASSLGGLNACRLLFFKKLLYFFKSYQSW